MPQSTAAAGKGLEVWGCARPAPSAAAKTGTPQRVAVEFKPAAGTSGATGATGAGPGFTALHTVTLPSGSCYLDVTIDFPSSGTVRLKWTPAHGRPEFSRRVAVTIR